MIAPLNKVEVLFLYRNIMTTEFKLRPSIFSSVCDLRVSHFFFLVDDFSYLALR